MAFIEYKQQAPTVTVEVRGLVQWVRGQGWALDDRLVTRAVVASLANYRAFAASLATWAAKPGYILAGLAGHILAGLQPPVDAVRQHFTTVAGLRGGRVWCPYFFRWSLAPDNYTTQHGFAAIAYRYQGGAAAWYKLLKDMHLDASKNVRGRR